MGKKKKAKAREKALRKALRRAQGLTEKARDTAGKLAADDELGDMSDQMKASIKDAALHLRDAALHLKDAAVVVKDAAVRVKDTVKGD